MNNTEADRRLLNSLNVKYKVCANVDCNNLLFDYNKLKLYCEEEKCKKSLNSRTLIRQESVKFYPVQKCTVDGCNEIGERHHEDYTQIDCLFLCSKHHKRLHRLKRIVGSLDENMIQHFLLGHVG